ncbi:MAG TPA: tyrosine-type recombinase/integrase [Polyangiaceae bacterium]|nr:tyrosine-type recombinase/integrase [Polyangiaceae bacterium]
MKSLLSHGHRTGYLRFNIGHAVRAPKVDVDVDHRSLTEVQIALMIQAAATALRAERSRTTPRPRYVRAALTRLFFARFLYYSGARVAEAVAVRWKDLRPRPDGDVQLSVLGKGRKRRSFPLPGGVVRQLEAEYKRNAAPDSLIFGFGVRRAQTIIRELAVLSGLEQAVSPHWYRHAAATHALDRGAPIHVVAQTLGHASLATTSRYAHKRADGAARYLPRI